MNISKKHRSWILGSALLLTVAATAAVNRQDGSDTGSVQPEVSIVPDQQKLHERLANAEPATDILVQKLTRKVLPEKVRDIFPANSWYVPPPQVRVVTRASAPPLPFNYIGKMLGESDHIAVFLEKQSRIFIVREGDAIDTNYRVDTITPPVMTLTYLPLDEKQIVQIGETN